MREQLYVVGAAGVSYDDYIRKSALIRSNLSPYFVRTRHSSMDVICSAIELIPKRTCEFVPSLSLRTDDSNVAEATEEEFDFVSSASDEELCRELTDRFNYVYPRAHLTTLPEKLSVSRTYPGVLDGDGGVVLFESEEDEKPLVPSFIEGNAGEESAKRGIATHMLMQFCDLERLRDGGAEAELERLVGEGFLSREDGERVRISEIRRFTKSRLFSEMLEAKKIYRELRFNIEMPAALLTEDKERQSAFGDRKVLVQGVIDCLIEYPDGSFGLFDYKTDRLTKEEISNPSLAAKKLRDKHSQQLSYYAYAVEKMFGARLSRIEVYSLPLGDTVTVG